MLRFLETSHDHHMISLFDSLVWKNIVLDTLKKLAQEVMQGVCLGPVRGEGKELERGRTRGRGDGGCNAGSGQVQGGTQKQHWLLRVVLSWGRGVPQGGAPLGQGDSIWGSPRRGLLKGQYSQQLQRMSLPPWWEEPGQYSAAAPTTSHCGIKSKVLDCRGLSPNQPALLIIESPWFSWL